MGADAGRVSVLASGRVVQGEDGGESSAQCRCAHVISWSLGLLAEGRVCLGQLDLLLRASQEVVEKRRLWAAEEG